jgi:hypothetical protein
MIFSIIVTKEYTFNKFCDLFQSLFNDIKTLLAILQRVIGLWKLSFHKDVLGQRRFGLRWRKKNPAIRYVLLLFKMVILKFGVSCYKIIKCMSIRIKMSTKNLIN